MSDDDELRAWAREVFSEDPPPPDIVRGDGPTVDDLRRMNDAIGTWYQPQPEIEVVLDVDGVPNYAGPEHDDGIPAIGYVGGVTVTPGDVARVGYTLAAFRAEFPNITVIDPTKRGPAS